MECLEAYRVRQPQVVAMAADAQQQLWWTDVTSRENFLTRIDFKSTVTLSMTKLSLTLLVKIFIYPIYF